MQEEEGSQMLKHELAKRIHNRRVSAPFEGIDEAEAARDNLVVIFGLDADTIAVRCAIRDDILADIGRVIVSVQWPDVIRAFEPKSLEEFAFFRGHPNAPRIDVVRYGDDDGEEERPLEWAIRTTGIQHGRATLRHSEPGFTREYDYTDAVVFSLLDLPDVPKPEFFGAEG
jgi:hypothetical protein